MSCSSKRKLVFLTVNCSYSHSSLALPLLHSACADLTHWEWLRYDMTNGEDVMTAVRNIDSCGCDLLVSDLYLFNRTVALDVLQRYHNLDPQCRIAVGGPECLGDGALSILKEYPWLDCVFRGEGEEIFRYYLEHFEDASHIPGCILPATGNAVYRDWAMSSYPVEDSFFVFDKPFVQMETSRGCPMGCFYCTSGGTYPRYRTLDQIRAELTLLSSKGVKELRILDRTFNLPQERGAGLLRMFREEFPAMRFHLELHPQFLNDELRSELEQAIPGQLHIETGIQCLEPEVQRLTGRRSESEKVLDGLGYLCRQTAFETHADLLSGLPGQTLEHIIRDTATLIRLNVAEIQLEVLKVLPGTPLRDIAVQHGICYSSTTPYDVMKTATMTLDDIQQARDLSRLLDLTYNHKELHETVLNMSRECNDFVSGFLAYFHQSGGNSQTMWDLKKRFLFLYDFCRTHHLERSLRILARQWLFAGYPPEQGPDTYSEKADHIPAGANLYMGPGECLRERETRYWRFPLDGEQYYLAYNRKYSFNRPASVWTITEE
ncbi:MAG: DUF4080 domain-containing protein [Lentisphaeria bacterium]|nr:DUF4080 domain-containing protein [Lentisphaeria bacterium]